MRFFITRHCKERYIERILNGQNTQGNLMKSMLTEIYGAKNITSKVSESFPRFVLYLKERYGKDKGYNILRDGDTIFIAIKQKGTVDLYNVVTCYVYNDTFEKFTHTCLNNQEIYDKLAML